MSGFGVQLEMIDETTNWGSWWGKKVGRRRNEQRIESIIRCFRVIRVLTNEEGAGKY